MAHLTRQEKKALKKAKEKKKERRKSALHACGTVTKVLGAVTGGLFAVYFWNLDQKLLGLSYIQVNKIFDRKKAANKF